MQRIIKWSIIGILGITLVTFSIVNRVPVDFSLFPLPFEVHIPLFIVLYITLFIGIALGEALGLLHSHKLRKQIKQSEQRIKALESEVLVKTMEHDTSLSNVKKIGMGKRGN